MSQETENLNRWRKAGHPRRWVIANRGEWTEANWQSLLDRLRASQYWPMHFSDVGKVLEQVRDEMNASPTSDLQRPISPVLSALLHQIAGGSQALLNHLGHFILDVSDGLSDRWSILRLAERDAWKTVELFLLQRLIESRFRDGELDAWVDVTPFGEDIKEAIEGMYRSIGWYDWPFEPKNFAYSAFLELRAARVAGDLYAERPLNWQTGDPEVAIKILDEMAIRVKARYPCLAGVICHADFDVADIARDFLGFRLSANHEMREDFAPFGEKILGANRSAIFSDIAMCLHNWPETVEELIGDIFAQVELNRRVRLAEVRTNRKPVSDEEVRQALQEMLGKSAEIHAMTLAEALDEAERLNEAHDLMVGINSLWEWFNRLSENEKDAIGKFTSKTHLWAAVRAKRYAERKRAARDQEPGISGT